MTVTNAAASSIHDRLDFMGIDQRARAALRELKPDIARFIGPALDAFYDAAGKVPATRRHFNDAKHMAAAKARQVEHWQVVASGDFGTEYAERVRAIGWAHARLGMEPRWYIGGYALITDRLIRAVIADRWPSLLGFGKGNGEGAAEAVSALMKAVMLDMDLAISTYLEALDEQRQRAEETRLEAERQQADALNAMSAALEGLASGDLGTRMEQPLAPQFDKLKSDFNATVAKLQEALSSVHQNAQAISAGSQEISSAADDLSRRTERQAASLEETVAALEEITATVKTAAQGASQAREAVAVAKNDAEEGGKVARAAIGAMGNIDKSSEQISQIIGVIDEIAFQTNLLALNAGVEAARAGEAGRGFAVVASEVRALAQRSADAAKQIKGLISTSTAQVKEGVELVVQTGSSFERIVTRVADINDVVAGIASGAQQQVVALQEVNGAVSEIDRVTQQNAAMAEEATAASKSLVDKTMDLDRLLDTFHLGGSSSSGAAMHRRPRAA
jgi:methyl-accepting chemotaxis protein